MQILPDLDTPRKSPRVTWSHLRPTFPTLLPPEAQGHFSPMESRVHAHSAQGPHRRSPARRPHRPPPKTPLGRDTITGPDQLLPIPPLAAGPSVPPLTAPAQSWPSGDGSVAEIEIPRYAPTRPARTAAIDSVGKEDHEGLVHTELGPFHRAEHPDVRVAPPTNVSSTFYPESYVVLGTPDSPISTNRWDASVAPYTRSLPAFRVCLYSTG